MIIFIEGIMKSDIKKVIQEYSDNMVLNNIIDCSEYNFFDYLKLFSEKEKNKDIIIYNTFIKEYATALKEEREPKLTTQEMMVLTSLIMGKSYIVYITENDVEKLYEHCAEYQNDFEDFKTLAKAYNVAIMSLQTCLPVIPHKTMED